MVKEMEKEKKDGGNLKSMGEYRKKKRLKKKKSF